jgi:hypothetical protein
MSSLFYPVRIQPSWYCYLAGIMVGIAGNLCVSLRGSKGGVSLYCLLSSTVLFLVAGTVLMKTAVTIEDIQTEMKSKGVRSSAPEIWTKFLNDRRRQLITVWVLLLTWLLSCLLGFLLAFAG